MTRDQVEMLEKVLVREAVAQSKAIGLFCRTGRHPAVPKGLFAQFWYRLGRTQVLDSAVERTTGLLQFSIIEPDGHDPTRTQMVAQSLAKSMTLRKLPVAACEMITIHKMGIVVLPRSNVVIVDGSFEHIG